MAIQVLVTLRDNTSIEGTVSNENELRSALEQNKYLPVYGDLGLVFVSVHDVVTVSTDIDYV